MMELELKRFIFGLSVIETYINHCKPLNLQDITIFSEYFCCDLMNSLYGLHLLNHNNQSNNTPGFDLISENEKIIVQVTTTTNDKPKKIIKTLQVLNEQINERLILEKQLNDLQNTRIKLIEEEQKEKEKKKDIDKNTIRDITEKKEKNEADIQRCIARISRIPDVYGYKLFFVFLCGDVSKTKAHFDKHKIDANLLKNVEFDYSTDLYDFNCFIQQFSSVSVRHPQFENIREFMDKNRPVFIPDCKESDKKEKIQAVIKAYSDNYTKPLFQHTYRENTKVTLQNMYVDPLFVYDESTEEKHRDFLKIYDDFLRKNQKGRILIIEGDAAIGKTSLVSWLCYYYSQRDNIKERNPFGGALYCNLELVCIRLRDLIISSPDDILFSLHEYFNINEELFKSQYGEAIFVLDGVDELKFQKSGQDANNAEKFISNFRTLFPNAKFIITSRPLYINKALLESDIYDFRTITLSHFTKEMRKEWVKKFCDTGEEISGETRKYILNLDDGAADGVADTPLALYLLSSCKMKDNMRNNLWVLYQEIFRNAIVNTDYNAPINMGRGAAHEISNYIDILYSIIEKIAYEMFQYTKDNISNNELKEIIKNERHEKLTNARIEKLCLLCSYWARTENQDVIEFYHNNIRDFFFAEFIYAEIDKCKSAVSNSISLDDLILLFCKHFYCGKVASTTWEQTFTFLYLHFKNDYLQGKGQSLFSQITCKSIKDTIEALLNSDIFWETARSQNYQSIKNIFYNYFVFIQIIYEDSLSQRKPKTELFNCDFREWQEVLNDWYTVFTQRITISKDLIIGPGCYTHWNKCNHYGKILDNVYFRSAVLDDVSFQHATLQNAVFIGSELINVSFTNTDLSGADFSNTKLTKVTFDHCNLHGVKFSNTVICDCIWKENDIDGVKISKSELNGCNWNEQIIEGEIINSSFENCELRNAKISNSISGVQFENCDLEYLNINGTEHNNTFIKSKLNEAKLNGEIDKCTFTGGSIREGNFKFTILSECKFINTDLSNSCFEEAKLKKTTFEDTKLENIVLLGAEVDKKSYDNILKQNRDLHKNGLILSK